MPSWLDEFGGDEFPLEIGSLYGVRYWSVSLYGMRSHEIALSGARKSWSPGENRASCLNDYAVTDVACDGHPSCRAHTFEEIPTRKCHCGFWAYWAPSDAPAPGIAAPSVMGVIEGWGNYRTGPKGFRCNTAQIAALHVIAPSGSLLPEGDLENWRTRIEEDLAARFKVPVYSEVATMLKAFPTSRTPPPPVHKPTWRKVGRGWRNAPAPAPVTEPLCAVCHGPATNAVLRTTSAGPIWACDTCVAPAQPCGCGRCAPNYARGGIIGGSVSSRVPLSPLDALSQLDERKGQWALG